jgi:hypothetical protein
MMRGEGMKMMALIGMADPTHSGTITKDAFVGAALKMFDTADANHDGKLTIEERKAAHQAMRGKMKQMMRHHRDMKMGAGDMPPPPPAP